MLTPKTDTIPVTPRTRLKRHPERGAFNRALVHAILDEGLVCHLGFAVDNQPFVIPTTHARVGDRLLLHGSPASRMLQTAKTAPICCTVTLLDGLVLARSAKYHSMNYRSAVVIGVATQIVDLDEKRLALDAIVEHILPGRLREIRASTAEEVEGTLVLSLPITEASAKVRSGPPVDPPSDYGSPAWAGVLPLRLGIEPPQADPQLIAGTPLPTSVSGYGRGRRA